MVISNDLCHHFVLEVETTEEGNGLDETAERKRGFRNRMKPWAWPGGSVG